jgi:regulator of ribonuclease activity A
MNVLGHTSAAINVLLKGNGMKAAPTTDLCDAHEPLLASGVLRVLPPVFQNYGGAESMAGQVVTLKCFEDNALVRSILETQGKGRVLMVDAGGSDRCALVGGNLAAIAQAKGWAGIVLHGCVRDLAELIEAQVGIWAIASHPKRAAKLGLGQQDIAIDMAGVLVQPGEWCYADADGILVSQKPLHGAGV